MTKREPYRPHQSGVALLLVLMMLGIFASLAAAMAMVSQTNLRSAATHHRAQEAMVAAEAGVTFALHRLNAIAAQPAHWTEKGVIDGDEARQRWAAIRTQFVASLQAESHYVGGQGPYRVALGSGDAAPRFELNVLQHPLAQHDYTSDFYNRPPYNINDGSNDFTADGNAVAADNPVDERWVRLTVTGTADDLERTVVMDVQLLKTVEYAILSRNRIMIGRNVMIDGPLGSHYTLVDEPHGHPIQMRDNFHGLTPSLDAALNDHVEDLREYDTDGDSRLAVADLDETGHLTNPLLHDLNGDGFIDTYDKLLGEFDGDGNAAISKNEFSSGGTLIDEQLWRLINEAKYPAGTEFFWDSLEVRLPGQAQAVDASGDLNVIDQHDGFQDDAGYAKINGEVRFKVSQAQWENGEAEGNYYDWFRGPIQPSPFKPATTFGYSQMPTFAPTSFDTTAYRNLATGDFQTQVSKPEASSKTAQPSYTPPSASNLESVPYQAEYPYDHYERPVYENYVFRNVKIPKGTNALFKNCKFIGVTFVETAVDNDDPNFNYAGMQESNGDQTYFGVEAGVGEQTVDDTKPLANNIRFDNCAFQGVVATDVPEAFSHTRNKLQFTGGTHFDIDAPNLSAEEKALFERSTILAPQYSIDIGTFQHPTHAGEVTRLEGAIVAGVIDIRGRAEINGSLITTFQPTKNEGPLAEGGSPANFNTTIGYFGAASGDAETEPPESGWGKILIRYDPSRPLPDDINAPITLKPDRTTYWEGEP